MHAYGDLLGVEAYTHADCWWNDTWVQRQQRWDTTWCPLFPVPRYSRSLDRHVLSASRLVGQSQWRQLCVANWHEN